MRSNCRRRSIIYHDSLFPLETPLKRFSYYFTPVGVVEYEIAFSHRISLSCTENKDRGSISFFRLMDCEFVFAHLQSDLIIEFFQVCEMVFLMRFTIHTRKWFVEEVIIFTVNECCTFILIKTVVMSRLNFLHTGICASFSRFNLLKQYD